MFDTLKALFGWPWFPRRKPQPTPPDDPVLPAVKLTIQWGKDPQQTVNCKWPVVGQEVSHLLL